MWGNRSKRVITGFELGERHHGTNLNQLVYDFGLSFNSDVVVSPKAASSGKQYYTTLE